MNGWKLVPEVANSAVITSIKTQIGCDDASAQRFWDKLLMWTAEAAAPEPPAPGVGTVAWIYERAEAHEPYADPRTRWDTEVSTERPDDEPWYRNVRPLADEREAYRRGFIAGKAAGELTHDCPTLNPPASVGVSEAAQGAKDVIEYALRYADLSDEPLDGPATKACDKLRAALQARPANACKTCGGDWNECRCYSAESVPASLSAEDASPDARDGVLWRRLRVDLRVRDALAEIYRLSYVGGLAEFEAALDARLAGDGERGK